MMPVACSFEHFAMIIASAPFNTALSEYIDILFIGKPMKNDVYNVKYRRRVLIRKSMTTLGKVLLALLANVTVNGREKLPNKGPVILAGNHVAVLEAVMMAVYCPGVVEFIGTGDIPFDPNYAFIANSYGLIPVNRGNLDRKGLQMGLEVLKQDSILGIFPEGGTWSPAQMQAQTGVAWLSYRSKAPIIPIGFGGIKGSLEKAFKFQRPKLLMNVGESIQPVTLTDRDLSMKANLEKAANQIMGEINVLIPEEDLHRLRKRINETYQLETKIFTNNTQLALPEEMQVENGSAYARFLFNPTIMDVLVRNLHLPIQPIRSINRQNDLVPLINAWNAVLDYLKVNPGYFTYRFGIIEGVKVKEALKELCRLGVWAQQSGFALTINPIRRFQNANTGAQVIEHGGCFPDSM
ncbi:MAG: lysophospholipid acyltransferase family protein [Chloroflexota bacterium]|nr:lysophospholipid acyltransferase family protein [Chloroflexota bacterium]